MTEALLIVGSYPPIPVAGAAATLSEVRRAWAAGDEVTVVAPRLSAAHLTVPVHGLLAGRRLANVRRVTGTRRLVLVVEDGYPFPTGPPVLQLATWAVLAPALKGFRHVRVVRAGAASLAPAVWARLAAAADEIDEAQPGRTDPGVTALGPAELTWSDRCGRAADRLVSRVLGPHGRAWLGARRRWVRSVLSAGPGRSRS